MSGPSEKAISFLKASTIVHTPVEGARAVHDPRLGLDRSVCLRDVVEYVRDHTANGEWPDARDIEREFGGVG